MTKRTKRATRVSPCIADLGYAVPMRTILTRSVAALGCMLCCAPLLAGPAPYWTWQSKLDGKTACSQTPLGPGWQKLRGPYKDSRCEKLVLAK